MTTTVLITGATSGLGLAFAKLYAQLNYRLILVAQNQEKLENLQKELDSEVIVFLADLSDQHRTYELCQKLIANNLIPDILINNAGIGGIYKFDEASFDDEQRMITINITTVVCLCNQLAQYMKKKSNKTYILNIASAAAFVPGPYQANYYATKAYILSYSQALSLETRGSTLSVTCFCPGRIASNFHYAAGSQYHGKSMNTDNAVRLAHHAMIKKKMVYISQ